MKTTLMTQALNIIKRVPQGLDRIPLKHVTTKGTTIQVFNSPKTVCAGPGTYLKKIVQQSREQGDFKFSTLFKVGNNGKQKAVSHLAENPVGAVEFCGEGSFQKIFMKLKKYGDFNGFNSGTMNKPKTNLISNKKWLSEEDSEKLIKAVKSGDENILEKVCKEIGIG